MIEIQRGMYGLPQAGILANIQLKQHLKKYGYYETKTHGLFRHESRTTTFTLVVDDFGVCTTSKADLDHLRHAINNKYDTTIDTTCSTYLEISIKWDYRHQDLNVSMPRYISRALSRFIITLPTRPQHSSHTCAPIHYGKTVQLTDPVDNYPLLTPPEIREVQEMVGVLLYYANVVDSTLLVALNTIRSQQSKATKKTQNAVTTFYSIARTIQMPPCGFVQAI